MFLKRRPKIEHPMVLRESPCEDQAVESTVYLTNFPDTSDFSGRLASDNRKPHENSWLSGLLEGP